jgi:shikimate kinase
MGSGKSKTAEALGKILNLKVIDLDESVSTTEGKSVSEIFNVYGQDYFRAAEQKALHNTLTEPDVVIATGGGTPCFFDNMEWMNANGITVYLEANAGLLFHRLSLSKAGRPLIENLEDVELMEQISGHLANRNPFYKMADITVNAASLNAKVLASKIREVQKF